MVPLAAVFARDVACDELEEEEDDDEDVDVAMPMPLSAGPLADSTALEATAGLFVRKLLDKLSKWLDGKTAAAATVGALVVVVVVKLLLLDDDAPTDDADVVLTVAAIIEL